VHPVPPIRILLAGPRLFAELIERLIGTAPDVAIVGTTLVDEGLIRHARTMEADAIVLDTTTDVPVEAYDAALYEFPTVKLVALASDWHTATISQLRPHRTVVSSLSRDALLAAIRSAVEVRC
jgi:DNA-binding NarL/FixJ family response regulator